MPPAKIKTVHAVTTIFTIGRKRERLARVAAADASARFVSSDVSSTKVKSVGVGSAKKMSSASGAMLIATGGADAIAEGFSVGRS